MLEVVGWYIALEEKVLSDYGPTWFVRCNATTSDHNSQQCQRCWHFKAHEWCHQIFQKGVHAKMTHHVQDSFSFLCFCYPLVLARVKHVHIIYHWTTEHTFFNVQDKELILNVPNATLWRFQSFTQKSSPDTPSDSIAAPQRCIDGTGVIRKIGYWLFDLWVFFWAIQWADSSLTK